MPLPRFLQAALSGELGRGPRPDSRHPTPASFPADGSRRQVPDAAAAALPSCPPGPPRWSNLTAKHAPVPARPALPPAGASWLPPGAGVAGQGAVVPPWGQDFCWGAAAGLGSGVGGTRRGWRAAALTPFVPNRREAGTEAAPFPPPSKVVWEHTCPHVPCKCLGFEWSLKDTAGGARLHPPAAGWNRAAVWPGRGAPGREARPEKPTATVQSGVHGPP